MTARYYTLKTREINRPNRPFKGRLTSKVYNIRETVPHINNSASKKFDLVVLYLSLYNLCACLVVGHKENHQKILVYKSKGWRGGLVVGRPTCDLVVAGSRPGRDAAA